MSHFDHNRAHWRWNSPEMCLAAGVGIWLAAMILLGWHDNVWCDEVFSCAMSDSPEWGDIIARNSADLHPPLYYFILRAVRVFTRSWGVMRLLSTLAVAGAAAAVWRSAARMDFMETRLRRVAGAAGGLILLALPMSIYAALEIRMYAFALLWVSWAGFFALGMVCKRRLLYRDAVGLSLMTLGALYTLNYCAPVLLVIYAAAFVALCGGGRRRDALKFVLFAMLTGVLYLPWFLLHVVGQMRGISNAFWAPDLTLKSLLILLAFPVMGSTARLWHMLPLLLALAGTAVAGMVNACRSAGKKAVAFMAVMILAFAFPVICGLIGTALVGRTIVVDRAALPGGGLLALSLGCGFAFSGRWWRWGLVVVAALSLGYQLFRVELRSSDPELGRLRSQIAGLPQATPVVYFDIHTAALGQGYWPERPGFMLHERENYLWWCFDSVRLVNRTGDLPPGRKILVTRAENDLARLCESFGMEGRFEPVGSFDSRYRNLKITLYRWTPPDQSLATTP